MHNRMKEALVLLGNCRAPRAPAVVKIAQAEIEHRKALVAAACSTARAARCAPPE